MFSGLAHITCRGVIWPEFSCDSVTLLTGIPGYLLSEKAWPVTHFSITLIGPSPLFLPNYSLCYREVTSRTEVYLAMNFRTGRSIHLCTIKAEATSPLGLISNLKPHWFLAVGISESALKQCIGLHTKTLGHMQVHSQYVPSPALLCLAQLPLVILQPLWRGIWL